MAYFAELDENNIVLRVLRIPDDQEHRGEDFLSSDLGMGGRWMQTSYNGSIRGRYASIGDIYDLEKDIFAPQENGWLPYLMAWNGITKTTQPSILIDSVARSGNIFLSACVNNAFSDIFQRWGYLFQHNQDSFNVGINNFDMVLVPLRNPIDSAASWIAMSGTIENSEAIAMWLEEALGILNKIKENKDNLFIVKFEDFTVDPNTIMSQIAEKLNIESSQLDLVKIEEEIESIDQTNDNFYSLPINNKDKIDEAKEILQSNETYASFIEELNILYNEII